jgi:hypothetical protein
LGRPCATRPYFPGIELLAFWESTLSAFFSHSPAPCGFHVGFSMPLFFFRIRNGRYSGCSEQGTECADRNAAWKELTSVCADMSSGISRKLAENSEWQMEMLDETKQPVFRIRIIAESLD